MRDANGHFSVSYVDMHGRTVATALAVISLTNLDKLSSFDTVVIIKTLADSNFKTTIGFPMQSKRSLLITKDGQYYFKYDFSPDSLKENL